MGETIGGSRFYKCKSCGKDIQEGIYFWHKKPQAKKNICFDCLKKKEIRRQTLREMNEDRGHSFY